MSTNTTSNMDVSSGYANKNQRDVHVWASETDANKRLQIFAGKIFEFTITRGTKHDALLGRLFHVWKA